MDNIMNSQLIQEEKIFSSLNDSKCKQIHFLARLKEYLFIMHCHKRIIFISHDDFLNKIRNMIKRQVKNNQQLLKQFQFFQSYLKACSRQNSMNQIKYPFNPKIELIEMKQFLRGIYQELNCKDSQYFIHFKSLTSQVQPQLNQANILIEAKCFNVTKDLFFSDDISLSLLKVDVEQLFTNQLQEMKNAIVNRMENQLFFIGPYRRFLNNYQKYNTIRTLEEVQKQLLIDHLKEYRPISLSQLLEIQQQTVLASYKEGKNNMELLQHSVIFDQDQIKSYILKGLQTVKLFFWIKGRIQAYTMIGQKIHIKIPLPTWPKLTHFERSDLMKAYMIVSLCHELAHFIVRQAFPSIQQQHDSKSFDDHQQSATNLLGDELANIHRNYSNNFVKLRSGSLYSSPQSLFHYKEKIIKFICENRQIITQFHCINNSSAQLKEIYSFSTFLDHHGSLLSDQKELQQVSQVLVKGQLTKQTIAQNFQLSLFNAIFKSKFLLSFIMGQTCKDRFLFICNMLSKNDYYLGKIPTKFYYHFDPLIIDGSINFLQRFSSDQKSYKLVIEQFLDNLIAFLNRQQKQVGKLITQLEKLLDANEFTKKFLFNFNLQTLIYKCVVKNDKLNNAIRMLQRVGTVYQSIFQLINFVNFSDVASIIKSVPEICEINIKKQAEDYIQTMLFKTLSHTQKLYPKDFSVFKNELLLSNFGKEPTNPQQKQKYIPAFVMKGRQQREETPYVDMSQRGCLISERRFRKQEYIYMIYNHNIAKLQQTMSNNFTLDDYLPPNWSAQPQYNYYFEIIKDGCVMGKLPIKRKPFNLIGRLNDLCDIAIDNQTVSRKHAILQAKQDDPYLYLYDLSSPHGTFVNKQKLPAKTYKKLAPYESVKFGASSRHYVLRCPQFEQKQDDEKAQSENKFAELMQNQRRQVSKEELKERYLDLLENDPFFAANRAPRTLMGRQQPIEEDQFEGIDWGITDEREVYRHRNQSDIPIEPDLLRRLNLDQTQLNKLAEYEDRLRKYQVVEAELNELTAREKREFGLQEKLRDKKEKLEKRFVQALEFVQKSEEWLRFSIFGEKVERDKANIVRICEKENDTFGDDEYFDRTLEDKQAKKTEKLAQPTQISTEDYWKIQKELKESLKNLQEVRTKIAQLSKDNDMLVQNQNAEIDELDQFMKGIDVNLTNQNFAILKREEARLMAKVDHYKDRLKNVIGEEEIKKMAVPAKPSQRRTLREEYLEKSLEENINEAKKKLQNNEQIQGILRRLQNASVEEEEVDELDPEIFNYYKGRQQQEDNCDDDLDPDKLRNKERYEKDYNSQRFQKPINKHVSLTTLDKKEKVPEEAEQAEEEAIDLTKMFK